MNSMRFGSDLGSTIVNTSTKLPFPGMYEFLAKLQERIGAENIFIISRVNEEQKVRAQDWLDESGFFEITRIPESNLTWCENRSDKGAIAAKLGLTHFVDDRPEVLIHMPSVAHRFAFRPRFDDLRIYANKMNQFVKVESWSELDQHILG